MRASRPSSRAWVSGLLLALVPFFPMAVANPVAAGSTDPTLAIGQLTARPVGGAALVEVIGEFGFDDVVQVAYPLNLVVYRGNSFARYAMGSSAVTGTFAGLADGLAVSEIPALEATGTVTPSAEIVAVEPNRLLVSLPVELAGAGTLSAVLYVEVPGEGGFVSNAPTVALTGGGGS